ncbi:MAG: NosD domain-containing protein [Candidatus Thorarchaeota archaeon]
MKRNAFMALMAAILLLQPFVGVASYSALLQPDAEIGYDSTVLAQEPGSRLESDDHVNHVPILIDESSDFTSQRWPGSGSEEDPYVISGLRIHYDVGTPLIQVLNQDAHFVVRDCLLIQNSTGVSAVDFVNTTHAMIEYTTIYSESVGIYGNNANNTIIDHVFGEGNSPSDHTVYLNGSLQVTISNSLFNGTNLGAMLTMYCHNLTLTSNSIEGFSVGWENQFSNYTSCTDLTVAVVGAGTGIDIEECHYSTFSSIQISEGGTGIDGVDAEFMVLTDSFIYVTNVGVYFGFSLNVSVLNSVLDTESGMPASFEQCHYAFIFGNNFTNHDTINTVPGLFFLQCQNGTIDGNTFVDLGDVGFHIDQSFNILVTNNYFDGVDSSGIYVDQSDSVTMSSNEYFRTSRDTSGYAINLFNSDFAAIISEYMEDINGPSIIGQGSHNGLVEDCYLIGHPNWVGVGFFDGENWTIQDNHIEGNWKAFAHFSFGQNLKILRNTLVDNLFDSSSRMIDLINPPDFEIVNNSLVNCEGHGIYITNGVNGLVEGNNITNVYQGIYSNTINLTINDNTIHGIEKRGIDTQNVINTEILNNDIEGGEYGLFLSALDYPLISGNMIANTEIGIHFQTVTNGIIENNNLTECGFSFYKQQGYGAYNHTVTDNFVNDLPFYYNVNGIGLSLDADDYGQIMFLNATDSSISNGEIVNATYGIILVDGDNIDITNVDLTGHHFGALIDRARNVSLVGCVFSDSYFIAHIAHDFLVDNLTVQDDAESCSITSTQGFQILNSFVDEGAEGFYIYDSQDGHIEGNQFFMGTSIGVWLAGTSHDIEIFDNEFKWCLYGVYGDDAHDINVTRNDFHDNLHGVFGTASTNWRITNNTFFANKYTGLWLDNVGSPFVVDNRFMNLELDGREDGSTNFWDDSVSVGNYWYVIPLVSPHPIAGSGGSTDRYPMSYDAPSEPVLNEPIDFSYAEGSEDNEIIWIVADDNPRDWEVRVDGELWYSDSWNFVNITANIDGLGYGTHEVFISVRDLDNNEVNDTVIVTVYDDTDPSISTPNNMVIYLGTAGNEMVWDAFDLNPDHYTVERLTGGEVQFTQDYSWTGGPITVDLDVLPEGTHILTVTVYDIDDNSASSSVTVYVVVDSADPEINSPDDVEFNEGALGNYITWSASDAFPSHYVIEENSTVVHTDNWGGTTITLNLDDLRAGYYTFVITVYDTTGNSATDAVNVTVVPPGGFPTIPPAADFTLLILIAVGAAGVVAIVAVFFLRKRKAEAL